MSIKWPLWRRRSAAFSGPNGGDFLLAAPGWLLTGSFWPGILERGSRQDPVGVPLTTIVLIRHAEPAVVRDAPSNGWVLSDAGREAAAGLAPRLSTFDLAELSTSPEPKAMQTAEIIANQIGGQLYTDVRLREHERSSVGFLAPDDFKARIASIFEKPNEISYGNESADAVYARFSAAINDAMVRTSGVVAAVTHGTAMAIYVSRLVGISPMQFWTSLAMPVAIVIKDGVIEDTVQ